MELINNLIYALRIYIIPVATTFRCVYCFFKIIYEYDEKKLYLKRIFNSLLFLIIAELVFVIKDIIEYYYY